MRFNQMVPPNVETMLLLDNILTNTFTGMISLLLRHQTIQSLPTIQTMLLMSLKRADILVVVLILPEPFDESEQKTCQRLEAKEPSS